MAPSWQQLLIVLILVLVLFGWRGRISSLMGDMAQGIKSFRSGLKDGDEETGDAPATLTAAPPPGDPAVTTKAAATEAEAPIEPRAEPRARDA